MCSTIKNLTSIDLLTSKFDLQGQMPFWQPGDSGSLDGLDSWGGEDPDGFIPLIFKKMSSVLSPKLSRVYRHLFKISLFPDERKIGNIAPVPKGALSADSDNYLPITILPVMSKVAEKLI